jgi:hypothetical protein
MKASEIKAKIEKIKAMSGISDKAKADMIAAWEKKLPKEEMAEDDEPDFEKQYNAAPAAIRKIIDKSYKDNDNIGYDGLNALNVELKKKGYEIDYGLDAEITSLTKIKGTTKGPKFDKEKYRKLDDELTRLQELYMDEEDEAKKADLQSKIKAAEADIHKMERPEHYAKKGKTKKTLRVKTTGFFKLKNPESKAEGRLIYKITNYNENTERAYITPINSDMEIPGQELVDYSELVKTSAPKTKTTHKYKGKTIPELDDKDCEDLLKETKERRAKAAKAEKKSKSRPIIEKVTVPIVKAVKKAIENISAADLKDKPGTELSRIDKAIAATKRYMLELKTILGEDWDKDTVDDEMKDLHALSKELHKKYGE